MMSSRILPNGSFLGKSLVQFPSADSLIGINEYDADTFSNWHDHENSYFAYIIRGGNTEIRKASELECAAGTLLFCNTGDVHRNVNYRHKTRILHVQLKKEWHSRYDVNHVHFNQYHIKNESIQNIFANLVREISNLDNHSRFLVEGLLLQSYGLLTRQHEKNYSEAPRWVKQLTDYLDSADGEPSLHEAAKLINIHPVTLSRDFAKYFGSNYRDCMHKRKLQRSLPALTKQSVPLESIAFDNGFADASHFIRIFKKYYGMTPAEYRKITVS